MDEPDRPILPEASQPRRFARAGLTAAGGAIPIIGGLLSAAAGAWSEHEQERVNSVFKQWLRMLEDELREKAQTIVEIMARLNMNDDLIKERVESEEYQDILKKTFRKWSNIETDAKRQKIRNLLANAAATRLTSDDVVRLFVDWIAEYSDFHFEVVGEIYRHDGVTRADIWRNLGREPVREDSADADLFKLLIRDLSTGGVIRQRRPTDSQGRYLKKARPSHQRSFQPSNQPYMKSAFDEAEEYVLTDLGKQFVHYAMNDIAPRIDFRGFGDSNEA